MYTMEILTTQQWKETNYWYIWPPGWVSRELCWVKKKPIPKGYLLYNSIYIKFSKWQNSRKGEWINGCQMLRRKFVGEKRNMRDLQWWECTESCLYQCQNPGCDVVTWVLQDVVFGEEMGNRHAVSPYYFLQLQVSLQLSQN